MMSDYHHTGRGSGYTINADGSVTRYSNSGTNRRSSSNRPRNNRRWGRWIFFIVVFVSIVVGISIYAYIENSYLYVSESDIAVSSKGETVSIYVDSNRDWYISTMPADWGEVRVYGNTIEWKVEPNPETTSRTDYIALSCTNCSVAISIEQAAKKYLTISPGTIEAPASGGSYSFAISSNESWKVSTNTISWGHLTKNGNALSLRIDENPFTGDRDDYFVITSNSGLVRRIDIHQAGLYLYTDKDNLVFDYYGTSQTIKVSCGSDWDIDVDTEYWAHLSRSGNTLTLSCDYNPGEPRYDWFQLKSGSLTKRVNFMQN